MTEEVKQKLKDAGREDLIRASEISESGYAGILPNGNIVDRRESPKAIPIPANQMLGVPEPKLLPWEEDPDFYTEGPQYDY